MNALVLYLAGLFTIPAVWAALIVGDWMLNKRHGIECGHCHKILGAIGEDRHITTWFRWKVHYLRYWYRTRPNWTCKKVSET